MNKNTRFGIIALALAGLAGLGYYAYTANRAPGRRARRTGRRCGGQTGWPAHPAALPMAVEVAKIKWRRILPTR